MLLFKWEFLWQTGGFESNIFRGSFSVEHTEQISSILRKLAYQTGFQCTETTLNSRQISFFLYCCKCSAFTTWWLPVSFHMRYKQPCCRKTAGWIWAYKKRNKRDEDITSIRPFIYSFAWTVNQQEGKRMLHLNGESNHFSLHVSMVIVRINVWLTDISFIVLYKAETKRQSFFILSFHLYLSPEKWFIR